MDKTFDDLFNEFFNRKNSIRPENHADRMRDEIKKMMDMLINFDGSKNIDEETEKQMDNSLGKPDVIETFSDGNLFFEKRIWHTLTGDIVKVIASDKPIVATDSVEVEVKPLAQQLEEALKNEDYLKAAEIRDLMNPPKKKVGRPKKEEKKSDKDLEK